MRALFMWVCKVVTQTFIIISICDPDCENQGTVLELLMILVVSLKLWSNNLNNIKK